MALHDRLLNVEDPSSDDTRSEFQRDRDRILYSSAFRRLGGVTQVVSANDGLIIHNRLTHTIKVAQVARRLAERLLVKTPEDVLKDVGGIDPDIAEAAALAHDLGHPPFGHIAEEELHASASAEETRGRLQDGFEGNAQSFRIVARQAVRTFHYTGLNLTRGTLNAILKYPWLRSDGPSPKRDRKWGAYIDERESFEFARKESRPYIRSVEAEIMDWADDIAYALHDTEDFYRAGLIPLDRLASGRDLPERSRFLSYYFHQAMVDDPVKQGQADQDLSSAIGSLGPQERFFGSIAQRSTLRNWVSNRIGDYIRAFSLRKSEEGKSLVIIEAKAQREIDLLKQLTWHYVIRNPALATQQAGQRKLIRDLFDTFLVAAIKDQDEVFPTVFADRLRAVRTDKKMDDKTKERAITRLVVDLIASMTEDQALRIHHKLMGVTPGSVMDQLLHHSIG